MSRGVQGLIVGNTTISRPAGLKSPHAGEAGGLSGLPLQKLSTTVLARASLLARGRLVLIGAGGVFTGRDALTKIQAGASLVQLYSSFAFHGPALIPRLKMELLAALRARAVRERAGCGRRNTGAGWRRSEATTRDWRVADGEGRNSRSRLMEHFPGSRRWRSATAASSSICGG